MRQVCTGSRDAKPLEGLTPFWSIPTSVLLFGQFRNVTSLAQDPSSNVFDGN